MLIRPPYVEAPAKGLDSPEARNRLHAKVDLLTLVDKIGVAETRMLLPHLGMVEHYGLKTVTAWLDHLVKATQ